MSEENGQSIYVVQHRRELGNQTSDVVWEDVATVRVPPRTKRKRIIETAFAEAGMTMPPLTQKWKMRVLDEESAREITVGSEEQPPKLTIA